MTIYFDRSLLVALYLPEARTPRLREWLAVVRSPIGLNVWQELEFKNAARQRDAPTGDKRVNDSISAGSSRQAAQNEP